MTTTPRFTSADLEAFPDDGKRYEIFGEGGGAELAGELGAALGQERLYVAFCDKTWILDCGEG